MNAETLRDLSPDELDTKSQDLREQLLKLRFQQSTGQIENPQMLRAVRKDIARVMTIRREKELGAAAAGEAAAAATVEATPAATAEATAAATEEATPAATGEATADATPAAAGEATPAATEETAPVATVEVAPDAEPTNTED